MAAQTRFPAGAAAAEWRAHWTVVLAAMLGYSAVGMGIYSLGAFVEPLHKAFGWNRTLITSGTMVFAITSVVCQPLVGRLIDRVGPRRIALCGVTLTSISLALFATANGSAAGWLLLWLVYSLCIQLMMTSTWSSAVVSQFEAGRGFALAFTLGGSALSAVIAPSAAAWLIDAFGWRAAYIAIALAVGAIVFLTTWLFFYSRSDRRRSTGGDADVEPASGSTLAEAFRMPAFYKLSIGIFAGYLMTIAVLVHLVPMLERTGLTVKVAAAVTALLGIFSFLGKLICGSLVNRFPPNLVAAAMIAVPIAGYLILMAPGQPLLMLAVGVAAIGIGNGSSTKMAYYLIARHFGLRSYATIAGFVGASHTICGGLGPLIGGLMFDRFGDYRLMLLLGVPLSIVSSILMIWLGDRGPREAEARQGGS